MSEAISSLNWLQWIRRKGFKRKFIIGKKIKDKYTAIE